MPRLYAELGWRVYPPVFLYELYVPSESSFLSKQNQSRHKMHHRLFQPGFCRPQQGPFSEGFASSQVRAICTAKKIALHMDGARLWEVQPYYDRPFSEICEFFDSVYVSFYKGMGGISGAMLLGKSDFIEVAREARDCLGAKMFCATPYTLHCHKQFTELVDTFGTRLQRLREMVKIIKEEVEAHAPGKVWFDPKEPQSCMIHVYLKLDQRAEKELEAAHQLVMNDHRVRLWNRMRGPGHSNPGEACYFEWSMGPANAAISDDLVRSAWQAFLQDFYKPQ
eukprot:TRINITY_DN9981_c0_g1_i5.p1 TRINITY_DN9981_c0_g1~~TRINITY_DN9981_c0_g1_i5.p1  ORF type:complete len:280 (-),score=30.93 TRINITY_DN9981_c0_g1_i5:202-1041(-)